MPWTPKTHALRRARTLWAHFVIASPSGNRSVRHSALQDEHSRNGASEQLKELWNAWVVNNYAVETLQSIRKALAVAPTPPDSPESPRG